MAQSSVVFMALHVSSKSQINVQVVKMRGLESNDVDRYDIKKILDNYLFPYKEFHIIIIRSTETTKILKRSHLITYGTKTR